MEILSGDQTCNGKSAVYEAIELPNNSTMISHWIWGTLRWDEPISLTASYSLHTSTSHIFLPCVMVRLEPINIWACQKASILLYALYVVIDSLWTNGVLLCFSHGWYYHRVLFTCQVHVLGGSPYLLISPPPEGLGSPQESSLDLAHPLVDYCNSWILKITN